MYATKPQLAALIRQFQTTGRMPDELVSILDKIVTGVAGRFRLWADIEDKRQEYFLLVMRKAKNIDPDGNVFGYLTTVAANCLRARRRRAWQLFTDVEGTCSALR